MDDATYRKKMKGCWLGKAIGGTLGMPLEGRLGPFELNFYEPFPTEAVANDDLDLQLLWLCHLENHPEAPVSSELLAKAWQAHVEFPWDEYGVCLRNIAQGYRGAAIGATDNWFGECMGAAIRSEFWACLAPGDPDRAGAFAYQDAAVDHWGDGIWAEVFLSRLQAAAFDQHDPNVLLGIAMKPLPVESRVYQAVAYVHDQYSQGRSVAGMRDGLIHRFATGNFTDVACNLGFTIMGWLAGQGDFGRSLCLATNCGYDTDCTAATLGALLGILDPDAIPQQWIDPIGEQVVLSPEIVGIQAPATLDELVDRTAKIREARVAEVPQAWEAVSATSSFAETELRVSTTSLPGQTPPTAEVFAQLDWKETALRGTWSHWSAQDFNGQPLAVKYDFTLTDSKRLRLMAHADTPVHLWLNGRPLSGTPYDPACAASHAPAFHRGGEWVFDAGLVGPGEHEVWLTVQPPSGHLNATDLVLGISCGKTNQWLVSEMATISPCQTRGQHQDRSQLLAT